MTEEKITILTLLSEAKLKENEYVMHVEVVLSKHAESTAKKRKEKEGFVNDPCLHGQGISPPQMVKLDRDKRYDVHIDITGCLEPKDPFKAGENKLKFHGKVVECRRVFALNVVPSEKPIATVHFYGPKEEDFLHKVIISVPSELVPKPSSQVDFAGSVGGRKLFSQMNIPCPNPSAIPNVSPGSDDTTSNNLSMASGDVADVSSLGDSLRGISLNDERCGLLLSQQNILDLARALGPSDAHNLMIYLGQDETIWLIAIANHPRDIVEAIRECLTKWNRSEGTDNTEKFKRLCYSLEAAQRNDLKAKIISCYKDGSLTEFKLQ